MIRLLTLIFIISAFASVNAYAGSTSTVVETDAGDFQLVGYFDLRDRESFIQITNTDINSKTVHIQLFDVGNLCNENNFFDVYTPNDTHTYNLRDIITNDGNPSGVVLPSNAYGIVVATHVGEFPSESSDEALIGNLRIEDNNGYEYRTNLAGIGINERSIFNPILTFNYNSEGGINLSDIVGISLNNRGDTDPPAEVFAADIVNIWSSFDIDIYDLNEVPFSCRNVIFACTDQENPLLPALLEESGDSSVASFEYGINEAISSSKNAPLLCPNNIIDNGIVTLTYIDTGDETDDLFILFAGLNNGNGRGSLDSLWYGNNANTM